MRINPSFQPGGAAGQLVSGMEREWPEEVWYSLYERARLADDLGKDEDAVIAHHMHGFESRPQRAETLCDLARSLRMRNRLTTAYPFARAGIDIPRPNDILFVEEAVYTLRALYELPVAAYYAGLFKKGLNGVFFGAGNQKEPLVGSNDGPHEFTIPRLPLRRRLTSLPRFIVTRSGEYCFMPGAERPALAWRS